MDGLILDNNKVAQIGIFPRPIEPRNRIVKPFIVRTIQEPPPLVPVVSVIQNEPTYEEDIPDPRPPRPKVLPPIIQPIIPQILPAIQTEEAKKAIQTSAIRPLQQVFQQYPDQDYTYQNPVLPNNYYKQPKQKKIKIKKPRVENKRNTAAYKQYIRQRYPINYAIAHAVLFVLANLTLIILQIALTVKNAALSYAGAGFWGGGFNIVTGMLVFISICVRHYLYIIFLSTLHLISIFVSLAAFVVIGIFAISFYSSCNAFSTDASCTTTDAIPIIWAMFGVGLFSAALATIFSIVAILLINGGCAKANENEQLVDYENSQYSDNMPMNYPYGYYPNYPYNGNYQAPYQYPAATPQQNNFYPNYNYNNNNYNPSVPYNRFY